MAVGLPKLDTERRKACRPTVVQAAKFELVFNVQTTNMLGIAALMRVCCWA